MPLADSRYNSVFDRHEVTFATDEEKSTIGASGNVYKYYLSANGDSFSNRVEINNFMSVAGSHYGYVVYKVFIPDGQTGAAAFGKTSSGVNVWCDMYVGGTLNTGRGCLIGADGIKTSSARTGEWMTSVIYVKSTQSSRFCFIVKLEPLTVTASDSQVKTIESSEETLFFPQ